MNHPADPQRPDAPPTPVLVSWSGGKDAAWTLQTLRCDPRFAPVALITTVSGDGERIAVHGIRRTILLAQAAAVGLPLIEMRQREGAGNTEYERGFSTALEAARERFPGLRHVAFGDLFLADIRAWREMLCARHGWTALFPLFGRNTAELAHEMLDAGLRARLCCVDTAQLDARFSGVEFDEQLLAALPAGVDPCGENGEFHTCVRQGPMFSTPLQLQRSPDGPQRGGRFVCTDLALGHASDRSNRNPRRG